ncbi:MAG TPA: YceI family protein [Rhodanobacteraceae bacterium]|nr:YceI family protein [Rhodanobacteraceae bacterium]
MPRTAFALLLLLLPLTAHARDWKTDSAHSTLGFSGQYQGETFNGSFGKFTAAIRYDPADPAGAKFDVSVDMASVDTQSSERDETLAGADFFDTGKFAKAHFVTDSFARASDGSMQATGTLTIRDRSRPVTLNVVFAATGDSATLDVTTTLDRLDFGLGTGADWADIGKRITVKGHLVLQGEP